MRRWGRRWAAGLALGTCLVVAGPAAAEEEGRRDPDAPRLLGNLLGAKNSARVRAGLWMGNLSQGLFAFMQSGTGPDVPSEAIGRGSGLVTELGAELTFGDYSFAMKMLTDELLSPVTEKIDSVENKIARTALRQLFGQLRSAALDSLGGARISVAGRYGKFEGPVDGTQFGFRDGQVWYGGEDETWTTDYLAGQVGLSYDSMFGSGIFLRYARFEKPQAIEIIAVDPIGLQTSEVQAFGLGFAGELRTPEALGPIDFRMDWALIPLTGVALVDYGPWGEVKGLLFETELTLMLSWPIEVGDWLGLEPYAGFRADMMSPIGAALASVEDDNTPTFLLPDYLLWGPVFGLEVRL